MEDFGENHMVFRGGNGGEISRRQQSPNGGL